MVLLRTSAVTAGAEIRRRAAVTAGILAAFMLVANGLSFLIYLVALKALGRDLLDIPDWEAIFVSSIFVSINSICNPIVLMLRA